MPQRLPWKALNASSYWALMRPTTRPSRSARNSCASPCLKNALKRRLRKIRRSSRSGGTQTRRSRVQPVRELDELPQVPPPRDGTYDNATREPHPICRLPSTSSRRSAGTSAPSSCAPPARPTCCPTSARLESPAGAGGRDGGRRADHARLQQLPRADRRRARDPGRARRARPLRHRPDRLAAAQRHDRPAPRARARARGVDGHRGGDRLHDRPPGQRRHARDDPRRRATR